MVRPIVRLQDIHHTYANVFSRIIKRLLESGIPIFWLDNSVRSYAFKNKLPKLAVTSFLLSYKVIHDNKMIDEINNDQSLGINKINLYILLIGCVLSNSIFVIEVIKSKKSKHTRKK